MKLPTFTRRRAIQVIAAVLSLCMLFYMGVIVKAHFEIVGFSPSGKSAGSLYFAEQGSPAGYCNDDIVETPKATWLIGHAENITPDKYTPSLPRQPLVIDSLLGADSDDTIHMSRFATSLYGDTSETTFISKLSAEGKFELVATVGGDACLESSPDGASVFLLTDLNPPKSAKEKDASIDLDQMAVFRSDDQGQNWYWLRDGLFPQAEYVAYAMKLGFYSPKGMWVFGGETPSQRISEMNHHPEGVIYHSNDLGRTVETIAVPPDMVEWAYHPSDLKRFVFQTADDRAYAWVSEDQDGCSSAMLELRLRDGRWQAGEMRRDPDICFREIKQSSDGRVLAIVDTTPGYRYAFAEWDAASQHWKIDSDLPNLFSPFPSETSWLSRFFVGKQIIVLGIGAGHVVPRWISWWTEAEISAGATYYSLDGGHSWRQFNLSDFSILGVGKITDRLFGYQHPDLTVPAFDLSH